MCNDKKVVKLFISFLLFCCSFGQVTFSHAYTAANFSAVPPFVSAGAPPLVMLVMERDEKLFGPAYNDASNLKPSPNDGSLDTKYNPSLFYYGYFDSYKCYTYNNTGAQSTSMFTPSRQLTNIQTASQIKCNQSGYSNEWSGNWLNYVTMSRMDALRAVLYGGYRSTDAAATSSSQPNDILTVLRRAYIPQDSHTWGKEYSITDGYNISDFTPYANPTYGRHLFANTTTSVNGPPLLRVLPNNTNRIWDWVASDLVEGQSGSNPTNVVSSSGGTYDGTDTYSYAKHPSNQYQFDSLVTTFGVPAKLWGSAYSKSNINGSGNPSSSSGKSYLNVFNGNLTVATSGTYTFACDGSDAVEVVIDGVVVTGWYGQHSAQGSAPASYSGQVYLPSGVAHKIQFYHVNVASSSSNGSYALYWNGPDSSNAWQIVPAAKFSGLTQSIYYVTYGASTIVDYTAQVQVCAAGMPEDNCEAYVNGSVTTYKPTGLLQRYGESGGMLFGLLSGSYTNNNSGGVLRKNIGTITDEINMQTGQFVKPSGGNIITTINNFSILNYVYSGNTNGSYSDCDLSDGETGQPANGRCKDWGNPIGEMMYETLRYFNGTNSSNVQNTATPGFVANGIADNNDAGLALPLPIWKNPYSSAPPCSIPFMLVLSDINPSQDSDSVPGVNAHFNGVSGLDILLASDPFNAKNVLDYVISPNESLTGSYYVGQIDSTFDGLCTAKSITNFGLGDIRGLCPGGPTKQGSYTAPAVAYYGRTHDINSIGQQNVMTYAVAMAAPLPNINISVGNQTVTMVPFGKAVGPVGYNINIAKGAFQPTSAIQGFFVQTLTPTHGVFRVSYADIEQGNDNDMDAVAIYEYQVLDSNGNATNIAAAGTQVRVTTTCDFAAAGIDMHLGYTISGTNHDGPYLEIRQASYSAAQDAALHYYADTPPGVWSGGAPVYPPDGALPLQNSRIFSVSAGGPPATIPKDPLWFAAKYGGFQTQNTITPTYLPKQNEWDSNGDNVPDTYYQVTNPLQLQQQLNQSFADILRRASSGTAASVISNSRSGEGAVYQSIFYPANNDRLPNTVTWVGDVMSLLVDTNGNLREDTNGDHALNIVSNQSPQNKATDCGDLIVVYNGNTINKYADCAGSSVLDTNNLVSTGTIDSLKYLWTAGNWLNSPSLDPLTQRAITANAVTGRKTFAATSGNDFKRRYIFTFIDSNQNLVADAGEQIDFTCSALPSTTDLTNKTKIYPYLNVFPPYESSVPAVDSSILLSCTNLIAPVPPDANSPHYSNLMASNYNSVYSTYSSLAPGCSQGTPPSSIGTYSSYFGSCNSSCSASLAGCNSTCTNSYNTCTGTCTTNDNTCISNCTTSCTSACTGTYNSCETPCTNIYNTCYSGCGNGNSNAVKNCRTACGTASKYVSCDTACASAKTACNAGCPSASCSNGCTSSQNTCNSGCATTQTACNSSCTSAGSSCTVSCQNAYDTAYINYIASYSSYLTNSSNYYNSSSFLDFLKNKSCREINYIRGQDQDAFISSTTPSYLIPQFRSRQFDYFNNGTSATWRLGDIVYSTPTVIGKPSEAYQNLYGDTSYAQFAQRYLKRRTAVYVGANDGMLHAFNGGFYNDTTKTFNLQSSGGSEAAFDLGAELWAYVPFNLLPHLVWLTDPQYPHVYYVDEKPRVFDARIFFKSDGVTPVDSDHVNGWGTVMVVGMRLGGGSVCTDTDKTRGSTASPGLTNCQSPDVQMSSAFIVMDITNPENPPNLLAELKFPGLGYTTCYPTVVPMGQVGGGLTQNNWYLVFGSGPAEADGTAGINKTPGLGSSLTDFVSNQKANLYVVDLKALGGSTPVVSTLTAGGYTDALHPNTFVSLKSDSNAFISDPISVDYQLDYKADAVYFGTVGGNKPKSGDSTSGWRGKLRRILPQTSTAWTGDSVMLDDEFSTGCGGTGCRQPITAAPTVTLDQQNNRWVFFGTGRFFVRDDAQNIDQQSYYGIIEPSTTTGTTTTPTWSTVLRSSLLDVTNAQVFSDATIQGLGSLSNWDALSAQVKSSNYSGWKLNFSTTGERNIGQAALLGSTLTFTTYVPSTNVCTFEGQSYLYGLVYNTGTAYFNDIFSTLLVGRHLSTERISLGQGLAATPNLHVGGEDGSKIFVQDSTGEIKTLNENNVTSTKSGRTLWREITR